MDKETKKSSSKSSATKEKRPKDKDKSKEKDKDKDKAKDESKVHKLSLKGSSRLVAEFRGVYPAEDFTAVKKYGLNMLGTPFPASSSPKTPAQTDRHVRILVSADDQVKAYIKKIMSQLDKWMVGGKISKLVIVITDKDTGEHVERWQFDAKNANSIPHQKVQISAPPPKSKSKQSAEPSAPADGQEQAQEQQQENSSSPGTALFADKDKPEAEIQAEIAAIFRQITASVTFLPQLSGDCTFNVLVYADADSDVPVEWGDSDAKEIENGERVQLRGFSTANHRVDTIVSYRLGD
ncbi:mitotic spindle checkpoint component mad2 [Trichoderma arundinaceum]|uniref:Mitotic spindle checkpoint component mad2 n=1 Tax=Trichoderma arundinaceum TaxID=490622 RepID=A0A395NUG4_TRIAR|nr:mitotic spindle checkpoint component mad2 [Trichoderma arundinaceum]